MNSEELRLDLELFLNQGLNRGLRGWPRKVREHFAAGNNGRATAPLRALAYHTHLLEKAEIGAFEAASVF